MNKMFFVAMLLISIQCSAQWTSVGNSCISSSTGSSATDVKLAINDNTEYIVYRDGFYSQKCTVRSYNGTSWTLVGSGGFSAGAIYYPSIAFSANTPYVAFKDVVNNNRVTVMKFDGTSWINVGLAGFSAGEVEYVSMVIIQGTPYVSFLDIANSSKATVMKYDGSAWVNVGSAGFSAGSVAYINIGFENNTVYVAYRDGANSNKATMMKFDGANWTIVGSSGFSLGAVNSPSLAFNGSTPYVAYSDVANSSKATVMKFDGANWVNEGNVGFSLGVVDNVNLAFNNGIPFITYRDFFNCGINGGSRGSVLKFNGSNWVLVGNSCFTHTSVNIHSFMSSLVFKNSEPFVAFTDGGCGVNTKVTVMKFGCNTASSINQSTCTNYTLNGQTYSSSGVFTQTIQNAAGCDSIITLNLSIPDIDSTITQNGNSLIAAMDGATYQWVDCNNNLSFIEGETSQTFTTNINGTYAVIVSLDGCSDTSECVFHSTVDILNSDMYNRVVIYPNPVSEIITIKANSITIGTNYQITDQAGRVVMTGFLKETNSIVDLKALDKGLYWLQLGNQNKQPFKIIKR